MAVHAVDDSADGTTALLCGTMEDITSSEGTGLGLGRQFEILAVSGCDMQCPSQVLSFSM